MTTVEKGDVFLLQLQVIVCSHRWEIAVCVSEQPFQQVSFVNSIPTSKGGTHVEYVVDLVVKAVGESTNHVLAEQIKNHMWVFINCRIANPTFSSQSKELMTLESNCFDSECALSEKFMAGIVEAVIAMRLRLSFKSRLEKDEQETLSKITGIPKLEDAREAGTRRGIGCTLILTQGDAAKAAAVCGLGVLGRDFYGVLPLKGKPLNVRLVDVKQMKQDRQISELVTTLGLQFEKKYENLDDLRTLRYGKILLAMDHSEDGSHIKGLVINFFHHNWPGLLKLSFLEDFVYPIIKERNAVITQQ